MEPLLAELRGRVVVEIPQDEIKSALGRYQQVSAFVDASS
jgi:hypothetical protein